MHEICKGSLMVKYFLIILFSTFCLSAAAQQGLVMDFGEIDSTEMEVQRQLEYHQFVNGSFGNDYLIQDFKLPEFSLSSVQMPMYTIGFDALSQTAYMGGHTAALGGISPYFHNTSILSQAAYNLGDKFIVGGFSYGSNHVMPVQLTNQQGSYFDSYGSTMFMKYKVSKSVSIETSISVGQNRGVGF